MIDTHHSDIESKTANPCPHCGGTGESRERPKQPLTMRQKQILDWIREYIALNGVSPTFGEIGTAFGYSSLATVAEHIDTLRRKGWVTSRFNSARALVLVER